MNMEMALKEPQYLLGGCDMTSLQVTVYCKIIMKPSTHFYKPLVFLLHWPKMNHADVNECWCSFGLSLQLRTVITGDCWIQVSTLSLQLPLATLKYPSALACQGTLGWAEWTFSWRRPHKTPLLTTLTSLSWTLMSVLTHLISLSSTARGSWERMGRRELISPGGGLISASQAYLRLPGSCGTTREPQDTIGEQTDP